MFPKKGYISWQSLKASVALQFTGMMETEEREDCPKPERHSTSRKKETKQRREEYKDKRRKEKREKGLAWDSKPFKILPTSLQAVPPYGVNNRRISLTYVKLAPHSILPLIIANIEPPRTMRVHDATAHYTCNTE